MYRQCTTEKTVNQQRLFQEVFFKLLQTRSYQEITVSELCEEVGLTRNIFYRLFDNKKDILYSIIDQSFYECTHALSLTSPSENLLSLFKFWKKKKKLFDILIKNDLSGLIIERGILYSHQLDSGSHQWIDSNLDELREETLCFYVNGFLGLILEWHRSGYARSAQEMAEITYQFLIRPPFNIKSTMK